jgi:hypothetical protein
MRKQPPGEIEGRQSSARRPMPTRFARIAREMAGCGELFGGVTPAASITRWKAATVGGDGLKVRPGR